MPEYVKHLIKKREYTYFISYFHQYGKGASCIVRERKIDSWDELMNVRAFIEKENHFENVVIIYYRRLKK